MTYHATVEQLYALGHELHATPSHKFDLAYVREMLAALGNPERRFPSVLIAGTNGKGSTGCNTLQHPAGCRIQDCALHLAAPGSHQRAHPRQWRSYCRC